MNIEKQSGITLVALTITIIVMMILASITAYYGTDLIKEAKLQDLRTTMLLIQAEAKKGLEEVSFQLANLADDQIPGKVTEANDNGILKGVPLGEADTLPSGIEKKTGYYYYYKLSESVLNEMGLKGLNKEEYGEFIVEYDIKNIGVEVINTKGYKGNYTLTQLNALTEEEL